MNNEDIRGITTNLPNMPEIFDMYDDIVKKIIDRLGISNKFFENIQSTPSSMNNIYYDKLPKISKVLENYRRINKTYRSIEDPFESSKTGE